jgi:hypothetical protein
VFLFLLFLLFLSFSLRLLGEGHESKPVLMERLNDGSGWIPSSMCWPLKMQECVKRFQTIDLETEIFANPSFESQVKGSLELEVKFQISQICNGFGYLHDGRGWIWMKSNIVEDFGSEEESDVCVVCLERRIDCGLVHGTSIHQCCCSTCAAELTNCPLCRAIIDRRVALF